MTILAQSIDFLRSGLLEDARLSLAYVVALLDPLSLLTQGSGRGSQVAAPLSLDEDLLAAFDVCRRLFPTTYAQVVYLLLQHGDPHQPDAPANLSLEMTLCTALEQEQQLVVPPRSFEDFSWGVPFEPLGIVYGADFEDQYPELVQIVHWLGGSPEDGVQEAFPLVEALIASLQLHSTAAGGPAYDLVCLLEWLTSSSGNSAVDYDIEMFWENGYELLEWSEDNIALMNEVHREARLFLDAAMRGVDLLLGDKQSEKEKNKDWQRAFRKNCKALRSRLSATSTASTTRTTSTRGKNHDQELSFRQLGWPRATSAGGSTATTAASAAHFL